MFKKLLWGSFLKEIKFPSLNFGSSFHATSSHQTKKWEEYNKKIFPPQSPEEPQRPAYVCHCKENIKYSYKKLWYIACLVRGMTVDEAIKQLSFVSKKGAIAVKETILEAQKMAVQDHNVEFKSNLWVSESFVGKGVVIKEVETRLVQSMKREKEKIKEKLKKEQVEHLAKDIEKKSSLLAIKFLGKCDEEEAYTKIKSRNIRSEIANFRLGTYIWELGTRVNDSRKCDLCEEAYNINHWIKECSQLEGERKELKEARLMDWHKLYHGGEGNLKRMAELLKKIKDKRKNKK